MSKRFSQTKSIYKPFAKVCALALVLTFLPYNASQAFQIRHADTTRIMKSKPYAESASFRVNADMLVKSDLKIREENLVLQAAAPVVPIAPAPTTPTASDTETTTNNSGGGSGGDDKYDASSWVLAKKYEELVQAREENDGSFLTSAPADPDLRFDYRPTNPNDVDLIYIEETQPPTPVEIAEVVTPKGPVLVPVENSDNQASNFEAVYQPNELNTTPSPEAVNYPDQSLSPEQVLINAPVSKDEVMVVGLSEKQKKALLKSRGSNFKWPWSAQKTIVEDFQASAPVQTDQTNIQNCATCADVLWWTWCEFVVLILVLIFLLVLLSTILQILLFRMRTTQFTPDNPRSLKYRMKKLLQSLGLLSLLVFSLGTSLGHAQATTTPQTLIYEGELLDDTGAPLAGSFTFRFSFWDNSDYEATDVVGGVLDAGATDYLGWSEVQTTPTLDDGSFSLLLSEVTPFLPGMFDQDNLFLQVEVKQAGDPDTAYEFVDINLDSATEDRKVIASVPFAFNANKLDYRDLGFGAGNIPYLDVAGLLPESVMPDLNLTSSDLDLVDITLSDFTNDLALNDGQLFVGDATNTAVAVTVSGDATMDNAGVFSLGINSVGEDELDFGNVTLADFTNDAGFLTTIDVSDNTNLAAGSGATLTDDTLSVNVGDTIESAEITDGTIAEADLDLADITLADFTNDAGFVTTDADTLSDLACAANEIAKWNGTAWICAPDAGGAAFTASDGITLTGSNFTNDFGTSIETGEITDGTITGADLDFGDITLADFTNDTGFLNTVDVSDNTNLAAGTGLTLTDDTLSADLGTSIATAEIEDDAVTAAKIGTAGAGDADKVLTTDGAGNPLWEDKSSFGVSTLTSGNIFVGNGANVATDVTMSGDATIDNTGALSLVTDSVQDNEIDYTSVTLADFINDAGFVTTDNDTTYTASSGVTLSGTNFTADLGTDIATAEIQDDAVTVAKIGSDGVADANKVLTTDALGDSQWEAKSNFATAAQGALADSALQAGDNVSALANDAGFLTTVDVSDNTNLTAGTGATLTGDTISVDLGTDIATAEIQDGAVTSAKVLDESLTADDLADDSVSDAEIDYGSVTLADFTNDAGFVTTDNDTTYSAGTGINLVGTTLSTTLGTAIDSTEIVDGSIAGVDLNFGDITLADFTNDAGFLTTVDVSDNTNLTAGTGATLTGDTISVDLGTTIESAEITDGTVAEADLNLTDITLADFTNDAGFVTTDNDTTYTAGTGITLTGTEFSNDLGDSIDASEIETNAVGDDEINYTAVTLNDFDNDAGFLTTVDISDDTNLAVGSGLMLIGDSLIANLGDSIVSGEIMDGTITDTDLNLTNITVSDFTNDANYLSTVDISDNTNLSAGTGLTLTGDSLSVDLGDSINASEIETNAVGDDEIDYGAVTLADFTNDAGFLTSASDTLADLSCGINEIAKYNGATWICAADAGGTSYAAGDGITLTGATFTNDFSTSIESNEITDGTIGDQDLDLADITLGDFVNDAGYITTDTDTLSDLACAVDEIARWDGSDWICAGASTKVSEILSPRYPRSIFEADGTNNTGSMFEEEDTLASGILGTVLRWFSRQVVLHDYDIVVQWTVPDDFDSFQTPGLSLDYKTSGLASDAVIDMMVLRNDDGIDELSASGMGLNSNGWANTTFTLNGATTWGAGDTMKIRLKMKAKDSNSAEVGNIKINYITK